MPPNRSYSGQQFGRITLESPIPGRPGYWRGHCDCGHEVEKRLDNLKRPGDHACGNCGSATPPLTQTEIRASLAATAERLGRLDQELASLKEQERSVPTTSPLPRHVTPTEGQAVGAAIEELRAWFKQEVGACVRTLEEHALQLIRHADEINRLCEKVSKDPQPIAAVRRKHGDREEGASSNAASPVDHPQGGDAGAIKAHDGDMTAAPLRWKRHPLPATHPLHRRFYSWETPEGFEVETDLGGTKDCLGFFDTLTEVQEAIQVYLDENDYTPEDDQRFFAPGSE